MRCKRCHTKLSPGKKTCPVCGTLVLKRRGSVKLAASAGGSRVGGIVDTLSGVDGRKLIAAIAAAVAVVILVCLFAGGCSGCSGDGCASCSSCSSCGSCASCTACASCGSCSACASCGSCAACDKKEDETVGVTYDTSLNGGAAAKEYYRDAALYYINGDNIVSIDDAGITEVELQAKGASSLVVDGEFIYYIQGGNIWRALKERPITVSQEGQDAFSPERILNATVSGSDAGIVRAMGCTVRDNLLCYWGIDGDGVYNILSRVIGENQSKLLYRGALTNIQTYSGMVFYLSRETADNGVLYCVDFVTGEKRSMPVLNAKFYTISKGHVYTVSWINEHNTITQIDLASAAIKSQWAIGDIDGMMANDRWIYYYVNDPMTGGDLYRMDPGSSKSERIFHDTDNIMLTGVAGDYFSLYTNIGETSQDRYTNASYYIFNAQTRERISLGE